MSDETEAARGGPLDTYSDQYEQVQLDDQLSPLDGYLNVSGDNQVTVVLPPDAEPIDPTSPRYELSDAETAVAVAAATADREQLARPPMNLDADDRPHFLRNVNGQEVCGQDGEPWPCPTWQGIESDAWLATHQGTLDEQKPAGEPRAR